MGLGVVVQPRAICALRFRRRDGVQKEFAYTFV